VPGKKKNRGLLLRNLRGAADVYVSRQLHLRPRRMPVLLLFITYRCNFNCAMCGVGSQPYVNSSATELTLQEFQAMLDSAAGLGCSLMLISGGEALLRRDMLFALIRYGRERGISTHLCTNGYLVNPEVVEELALSGVKTVSVSLESAEAQVHETIRGPGTFGPALAAIGYLRTKVPQIQVGINCTISAVNFSGLTDMVTFAEALHVQQLKFAPLHTNLLHSEKPRAEFSSLLFEPGQIPLLEKEIARLVGRLTRTRLLSSSPYFLSHIPSYFAGAPPPRSFKCYAGYAACTIDPFGNASPCPDLKTGLSVRQAPLHVLWRSPEFQQARRAVLKCSHCWDPLYTELSLRLQPRRVLSRLRATLREVAFYHGTDQ